MPVRLSGRHRTEAAALAADGGRRRQDNAISWYDWSLDAQQHALLDFTRRLIEIRREHPLLWRSAFFDGEVQPHSGLKDVTWLRPDGGELSDGDWSDLTGHALGRCLAGGAADVVDAAGDARPDRTLLVLLNAAALPVAFVLPDSGASTVGWELVLDTAEAGIIALGARTWVVGKVYTLHANTLALLRAVPANPSARLHRVGHAPRTAGRLM